VELQVGYTAIEAIKSKLRFKWMAANIGVQVHAYHTDIGIYHSDEFLRGAGKHAGTVWHKWELPWLMCGLWTRPIVTMIMNMYEETVGVNTIALAEHWSS